MGECSGQKEESSKDKAPGCAEQEGPAADTADTTGGGGSGDG